MICLIMHKSFLKRNLHTFIFHDLPKRLRLCQCPIHKLENLQMTHGIWGSYMQIVNTEKSLIDRATQYQSYNSLPTSKV